MNSPPFIEFREKHWTDEDFSALQYFLLSESEDLTPQQLKDLASLMKDMVNG